MKFLLFNFLKTSKMAEAPNPNYSENKFKPEDSNLQNARCLECRYALEICWADVDQFIDSEHSERKNIKVTRCTNVNCLNFITSFGNTRIFTFPSTNRETIDQPSERNFERESTFSNENLSLLQENNSDDEIFYSVEEDFATDVDYEGDIEDN